MQQFLSYNKDCIAITDTLSKARLWSRLFTIVAAKEDLVSNRSFLVAGGPSISLHYHAVAISFCRCSTFAL